MKRFSYALVLLALIGLVAAQGLPGVVSSGSYTVGGLGMILQPKPAALSGGTVYRVGAWPLYTAELADGPGKELVMGYCSVCHSVTYITMQPPLKDWAPTVNKMIKTYGAQIPEDAVKQILAYLQAYYSVQTRKQ
ncbi:MAG: sulfide dehydrogenase [Thermus sp.]|uniref:sulfide dehydrogenase n=1 Tax=Thermus sp. TaxID=275 RepID=UPI0033336CBA